MHIALTHDTFVAHARADLELAELEIRSRTNKHDAVRILLTAARVAIATLGAEHPERSDLLERYQQVRGAFLDLVVDQSDEVPIV